MLANKVSGTSLGQFRLKGVAEKIEIHHCRKVSNVAPARRASSLVMSMADHWKWEQHLSGHGGGGMGMGGMGMGMGMGLNGNGNGGLVGNGDMGGMGVVGPEDVLLGGDSLRGAMLSPRCGGGGGRGVRVRVGCSAGACGLGGWRPARVWRICGSCVV